MDNYELYKDENGNTIFPVHIEQYGYIDNERKAQIETGKMLGYENVGILIDLPLSIDADRMEASIKRVIEENEGLRAICIKDGDKYKQKIVKHYDFKLNVITAKGDTDEERKEDALNIAIQERQEYINIFEKIGHKEFLIKLSDDHYYFMMIVQHWLGEDTSLALIWNQISNYYLHPEAETQPHVSVLEYLREAQEYMDSQKGKQQKAYWDEELKGYEPIPIGVFAYGQSAEGWDRHFSFPLSLINSIAKANKTSNFLVLGFATHIAISILAERNDTLVGYISANRSMKYMRTIGYLARKIPSRLYVDDKISLCELFKQEKKKFSTNLLSIRGLDRTTPFQFLISYQNYLASGRSINEEFPYKFIDVPRIYENGAFAIIGIEDPEKLDIMILANRKIYSDEFMDDYISCLGCVFEAMKNAPDETVEYVRKNFNGQRNERA